MFAMNRPISAIPQKQHWAGVNHCFVYSEVEHVIQLDCPRGSQAIKNGTGGDLYL